MKAVWTMLAVAVIVAVGCSPCDKGGEDGPRCACETNKKCSCEGEAQTCGCGGAKPKLLVTLPSDCNTPDGCCLDAQGNIILSIPNFNNGALIKAGKITEPSPARMVMIDKENKLSTWYEFKPEDLHPDTKIVGPMDCAFGPDGNLYLADNQLFNNPTNMSRLLRINMVDGKPTSCDVVVQGFVCANAVVWDGDTVYVSDTVFKHVPNESLTSGAYAIKIDEWKDGPVTLAPYTAESPDPHLVALYKTSGRIGFGADGLCVDEAGNLYCGIFEDGIIFKTTFDENGKPKETTKFAEADCMECCDGIIYRAADKKIYVADMLINGVQAVDMDGNVTTIHKNGDTTGADGSLDQPCEVLMRGNELIVVNMDMPWESDLLTNKQIDEPYTISAIELK